MAAGDRRLRRSAAQWVVAGLAIVVVSSVLGLIGLVIHPLGAIVVATVGAIVGGCVVLVGTRRSLLVDRPPPGLPPLRHTVALHAGVAGDNSLLWMVRRESRGRATPDWARSLVELTASIERRSASGGGNLESPLPGPLDVRVEPEQRRYFGRFEHLTFDAEFQPTEREAASDYSRIENNRTAHAFVWRHDDEPRPTLLCIHGYKMGRLAGDELGFIMRGSGLMWLHRELGLDVVEYVLPLHGPRKLGRHSGEAFMERDPIWTLAAVEHAVWDCRRLLGWLRAQGVPSVGVHGLSMGGLVASLLGSVDDELACVVPVIPAVRLSALLWRQMPPEQQRGARKAGFGFDLLDRAWRPINPLHHRPRVRPEGRFIIAGLGDRVVTPDQPHALWKHWEQPSVYWYNGGHLAFGGRQSLRTMLESHLRMTLLSGRRS